MNWSENCLYTALSIYRKIWKSIFFTGIFYFFNNIMQPIYYVFICFFNRNAILIFFLIQEVFVPIIHWHKLIADDVRLPSVLFSVVKFIQIFFKQRYDDFFKSFIIFKTLYFKLVLRNKKSIPLI